MIRLSTKLETFTFARYKAKSISFGNFCTKCIAKRSKIAYFKKKKANFGKLNLRQKAKICLPNRLYIYIYI